MQNLSPLVRAFLQCYKVENFALAPELLTALKATAAKASAYQVAMQKLVNILRERGDAGRAVADGIQLVFRQGIWGFSKGQSSIDTKVVLWLLSGGPRRAESNTDSCLPNVRIKGSTRQGQPYSEDPATATSFKLVISYPKSFAGRLIGEKGATMKRLKEATPAVVESQTAFEPATFEAVGDLNSLEILSGLVKQALNITDPSSMDETLMEIQSPAYSEIVKTDQFALARKNLRDRFQAGDGKGGIKPLESLKLPIQSMAAGIFGSQQTSSPTPRSLLPLPPPAITPIPIESDEVPKTAFPMGGADLPASHATFFLGNPFGVLPNLKRMFSRGPAVGQGDNTEPAAKIQRTTAQAGESLEVPAVATSAPAASVALGENSVPGAPLRSFSGPTEGASAPPLAVQLSMDISQQAKSLASRSVAGATGQLTLDDVMMEDVAEIDLSAAYALSVSYAAAQSKLIISKSIMLQTMSLTVQGGRTY